MSRYGRDGSVECKVYVGDLPRDAQEKEIERAFSYYGPLKNVWVARNPPGFAFVEFEDPRDADDSVRGLDGSTVCGTRVRVELSTGKVRPKPWTRGPPRMRRAFDPSDRCFECGDRGHYAYDCPRFRGSGGSRRKRSYSRSRSRSFERSRRRSYSRSRSGSRGRRSYRSRSRSPYDSRGGRGGHDRTRSRSISRSRSPAPRSRSPARNGDTN